MMAHPMARRGEPDHDVRRFDRKGAGPKNQFDCAKAIDFFNRHGNTLALRRGEAGVREYVAELLARPSA